MSPTNNGNGNGNGSLPAGEIRFYDNYLPPLDAGDYVISAQQSVNSTSVIAGGNTLNQTFPTTPPLTQAFTVVAPRFTLDPADIHSVFPPASSTGTFDQNLSHIVLTKRNLPWERFLVSDDQTTPWMALLLLSPDEIIAPANTPPNAGTLANPSRAGTYNLPDVLSPPAGTLGPSLTTESQDLLGQVTSLRVTSAGSGYTSAPTVEISGGGGTGATATAQVQNGAIALTLTGGGTGYTSDPTVTISGGGGTGATATAQRGVVCRAIDITTATFTQLTPRVEPTANPAVNELKYLAHCRQVSTADKVITQTKDDGWFSVVIGNRFPGPGAGPVLSVTLIEEGLNYTSAPTVTISGGGGTGATAVAQVADGIVTSLTLVSGGSGYTSPPTVSFSGGGGSGATGSTQIGAPWVAHLVSLEGYENYLVDSPAWPSGTNNVRLVSLYSWNFTCLSESGDFRDLMLNLIQGEAVGGAGLLLRLPVTSAQQPSGSAQATVQQALNEGYAAVSYETMIGDDTFAWYRGPFAPAPRPLFQHGTPYGSSAAAMIYDQSNALFDQSYAVAWQTGRLVALADQSFGAKLLAWRRAGNRTVNLLAARLNSSTVQSLTACRTLTAKGSDGVDQLRSLLKRDLVSSSFMSYLTGDFSKNVAPLIAQSAAAPSVSRAVAAALTEKSSPAAATNPIETLRSLYDNPAVQQLLLDPKGAGQLSDAAVSGKGVEAVGDAPSNGTDPLLDYITAWLGQLRLFYGVPFVNLVPDARMLPQESLRFFFIDPNYLDALVAGALSIGMQSSRDQLLQAVTYPGLLAAAQQATLQVRSKLSGRAPQAASVQVSEISQQAGMAGLLLRSSVVSGWPGLEVRVYSDEDGTTPLPLARMDRLAPDLLLCLFPDT
ncbi:MAG: hypothetical protein JO360_05540, partial [Acidobacteria bacterium]|nr:hypothetical protein [Acidobacteriota bacterium]